MNVKEKVSLFPSTRIWGLDNQWEESEWKIQGEASHPPTRAGY